jgi:hypothetical protein
MKNLFCFLGKVFFILTAVLTFGTCGIDDYILLAQIPRDTIVVPFNNQARITQFPSQPGDYFMYYEVYYRIYISGHLEPGTVGEGVLRTISPSLSSHYTTMQPYTNVDTATATNVGTIFSNLGYFPLEFNNTNYRIGGGNHTVTFEFALTSTPEPSIIDSNGGGVTYALFRSSKVSTPAPNNSRYFLNNSDLNSSANAVATINADVQDNSSATAGRYTYISLYIVAVGNDANYSRIFGKPTFIGVFLLPDGTR